jgi:Tol biopolymer transport system component
VLPGTEGGVHPFWSPDGKSLGFVVRNTQKRIDLAGGAARDLLNVGGPWHGAWSGTGEILGLSFGNLFRVSDQGGSPKQVEGTGKDTFPAFLSDGKRFLVRAITDKGSSIELATLGSETRTLVLDNVLSAPVFAPTPGGRSYLLFLREASLMAMEFDEARGTVVGDAVVVVRGIGRVANPAVMPAVGVSRSGVLAYQSADEASVGQLTWVDRSGRPMNTLPVELAVANPTLSPDESSIVGDRPSGGRDIWVANLKRGSMTRVTFDETLDSSAVWSNDGKRVAFSRSEKGILAVDSAGAGSPEVLTAEAGDPMSWSVDGKYLLYTYQRKLFVLEIGTTRTLNVGSTNGVTTQGRFSPDGKYIAYVANEAGRPEVYVQPMPPATGRIQVSLTGGLQPRWSDNGKEIFFLTADDMMMASEVTLGPNFSAGVPRELFKFSGRTGYDVSHDSQRFLIVVPPKEIEAPITVVLNWWLGLQRPAK